VKDDTDTSGVSAVVGASTPDDATAREFDLESALDRIACSSGSVSVLGSMNADYTVTTSRLPQPGETVEGGRLQILSGGKSGNQASSAARLGAKVSFFGAVGDDSNADFLLSELADAGIDLACVKHVPGPSGTTVITVDGSGENTIVYSAGSNAQVSVGYVHEVCAKLTEANVLGLCLESPVDTVIAAAVAAHDAGMKVLLNDSPFHADLPKELIEASDILLVNEHEAAQLLGFPQLVEMNRREIDWNDVACRMGDYGFTQSVVTLGAEGSYVLDSQAGHGGLEDHSGDAFTYVKALSLDAVDTTGCGDAFMGSILSGLAAGMTLAESAQLAAYVSAYAATGLGAQASYGTSEQIIKRFA
jgi:ribokinase